MEPVKASAKPPVKAAEAPKRTQSNQQSSPQTNPDAVAAKKAAQQQATRPTVNTRGETLGRHLNVTA